MIMVTHYPNEIPELFQKCLLLKNGKMFKTGIIEEVFTDSVMSEYFAQEMVVHKIVNGYQFIPVDTSGKKEKLSFISYKI